MAQEEPLVLTEARKLVRRGFSVIPLAETHKPAECNDEDDRLPHACPEQAGRGSKRPAIASWKEYQTRLPTNDELAAWFENHQERGLAIVCGPVSAPPGKSLVGIDSDGPLSNAELVGGPAGMPGKLCAISQTGRKGGGNHTFLYVNDSGKKKTHTHVKGERVDIQTQQAYCVVYPTIHPKSARQYQWLNLPDKLFDANQTIEQFMAARGFDLRGKRCAVCYPDIPATEEDLDEDGVVVATDSGHLLRDLQTGVFRQGGRHEPATEYAGFIVAKLGPKLALPIIDAWNQVHCKPPLSADEIKEIVTYCGKEDLSKAKSAGESVSLAQIVDDDFGGIIAMLRDPEKGRGMSTGHAILDGLSLGVHKGKTITIGARPGVGKTAFAADIAIAMAIGGNGSIFYSLEMSRTDLLKRAIGAIANVNIHQILSGRAPLDTSDEEQIKRAAAMLRQLPILIDDTSGLSPAEIIRRTEKQRVHHNVNAIFVDYLHLLGKENGATHFNREGQISEAVVDLAGYGKKRGIAIVLLSQLNRMVDSRSDGPRLSDLRDSGMIEQRSDTVWLLQGIPRPKDAVDYNDQFKLHIAKSKDGPPGGKVIFQMEGRGRKIKEVRLEQ
jgi:replicative DNA helicase